MLPDMLDLQQLHKPGAALDVPAIMSCSEVKDAWLMMPQPNTLMVNGSTEQLPRERHELVPGEGQAGF